MIALELVLGQGCEEKRTGQVIGCNHDLLAGTCASDKVWELLSTDVERYDGHSHTLTQHAYRTIP